MAKMIPNNARMFSIGSLEDIMFKSLQKLPDDYYVFHSFKILTKHANTLNESETDFIIFNRHKGILCLEAKNGSIYYTFYVQFHYTRTSNMDLKNII